MSLQTIVLALTILFAYTVNEQYFALGRYFILPVCTIITGTVTLIFKTLKTHCFPKKNFEVFGILFFILLAITIFQKEYNFDMVASYCMIWIMFYVCTILPYTFWEIKFLLNVYIISALILAILLFYQLRMPYLGYFRFSVFFSDKDYYDVNFLSSYMLLPALISFYFAWLIPWNKWSLFYGLANFVILAAILATGSRGALVGFCIGLFPLIKHLLRKKILIFVLAGLCILIYFYIPHELAERLFLDSYNDGSNSRRLDDWTYGIMAFLQHPLFGNGFSSSVDIIIRLFYQKITAHNSFLLLLINFGIIGIIPFLSLLFKPLLCYKKSFLGIYTLTFYLAFLFNVSLIEAATSFVFIVPMILFFIIIRNPKPVMYVC